MGPRLSNAVIPLVISRIMNESLKLFGTIANTNNEIDFLAIRFANLSISERTATNSLDLSDLIYRDNFFRIFIILLLFCCSMTFLFYSSSFF